ncbi:MAG: hypothetical protein QW356_04770, partial [Candidatus Hadarchaeales archaeon]
SAWMGGAFIVILILSATPVSIQSLLPENYPNNPPILSMGKVLPTSGMLGTIFTYEVIYTDPDGDPPSLVTVCIDDVPFSMRMAGGAPENALFQLSIELGGLGTRTFHFEAVDARGARTRLPPEGEFEGPVVFPPPVENRVDNQPPVITLLHLTGNPRAGQTVEIRVRVTDDTPPIQVVLSMGETGGQSILKSTALSESGDFDHRFAAPEPGQHPLFITATDGAGNTGLYVTNITVLPPEEIPEKGENEYTAPAPAPTENIPVRSIFENLEGAVKTIQLVTGEENAKVVENKILEGKAAYLQLTLENNRPTATKIYDNRYIQLVVTKVEVGKEVEVAVDSPTPAGKTVILNLEEALLPSQVVVLVDNVQIPMADNYEDVMDPTGENTCEYLLLMGARQVQVLISIPHFSRRVITIRGPIAAGGTWTPLLLSISVLVIVAVLLYTFRKTRPQRSAFAPF